MDNSGLVIYLLIIGAVWFVVWGRNSELRYQAQYGFNADASVSIAREPTDCDFLSAPLGSKDCHYEKVVAVEMYTKDVKTGRPIVSYDEGKTWNWNDGGPTYKTLVDVSWRKVSP